MSENNESTIIDGEANTRMASFLSLRGALRMEVRGMKRSSRSALAILRDYRVDFGDGKGPQPITTKRTAKGAYADLDAFIVKVLGPEFAKPLPAVR